MLQAIHHVAIIASDYARSKRFYNEILGLEIVREVYRAEQDSWKLDLAVNGTYQIELFSFPNPPTRPSRPEACGLRHLAFSVKNLEEVIGKLAAKGVETEPIRVDEHTDRCFTFLADPDGLPVELYEMQNHDSEDSKG